jgi:hypothetical protein
MLSPQQSSFLSNIPDLKQRVSQIEAYEYRDKQSAKETPNTKKFRLTTESRLKRLAEGVKRCEY